MTSKKRPILRIFLTLAGVIFLFISVVLINLIIVFKSESVISRGKPVEHFDGRTPALIVVDIQEATTGDVSMYPYFMENSTSLLKSINQLVDSFSLYHLPVVYVRSEITNPLINLINNSYAKGSPGAGFDKHLKVISDLEVEKKGKDSFRNTRLDSILISHKVNELYITGLDAAECVNATVEAAQNRGYRVNIVEESVISKSRALTDSMMVVFKNRGVRVIRMENLLLKK